MSAIISLDLAGFVPREDEDGAGSADRVWDDERGVVLSVHDFAIVPDLVAPLDAGERLLRELARYTARSGAALIEAEVRELGGVPGLWQLIKIPRPSGPGQIFVGAWTVPRDRCSVVLKVQAAEGAVSGMREAVVADRVGFDTYFRPHPYDPQLSAPHPYHVADLPEWDAHFPTHPLTLVRQTLARVGATAVLDDRFRALPPFTGPAPDGTAPAEAPRRRWWQKR
ncbi:hypothetical protein GCM10018790_79420 [Kitasatospora xanthocidica]|uniref:hypothetical protein n=1 Tax=Kitasatospora xanthocidica TaxID=83382 RepID=UPI00167A2FE3|nr:hypothetical protein [Kitasatospora xanthocidica]GHF90360.1 hypothetical protein GCM10018790_79420 [Kitasatospora xanthocidica]